MGLCGKKYHKGHEKHDDFCDEHEYDCDCHWKPEKNSDNHKFHHHFHRNCVEEVLEAIDKAQRKVRDEDDCKTSCKDSIDRLMAGSKKPKKNTIPFILYCGDCEPFKATGVTAFTHHSKEKKFACITSFIFKIKEFDGQCAVLELLTFKHCKSSRDPFKHASKDFCSPCSQIDHENIEDLAGTGICINVDLSCFCAVTCLPAVRI
ncbi:MULTISPECIES: CotY/CotZ family spore coat protein [unclassified Cytobacillus]|uniref:CotY/CotZ family spore coat protein n=1 Tax=unclassified Cytobacillus TaxID=2675268 RepID=UPI001357A628|nr:CotY/CotZ family spore coat protein [Cytobacillus sp. AMY 15.2]KAF0817875.1 Spore coat protein Y [Bacillus sp. ZZV12-4809]MCM3089963.1 CotY/CotZ family spore coat protein [Cytobacillus sp. AMY 15.2]